MPVTEGDGGSETDHAYYAKNWATAQLAAPDAVPGTADGFRVDPERAQECIAELTRIVNEVRRASLWSMHLTFDPPGSDEVSVNFARNGVTMAGRAEAFVRVWADQIQAARDGLQAQLDSYRGADADAASRLT